VIRHSADGVANDLPIRLQELNHMKRFLVLGGLLVAASFVTPVAVMADSDHHRESRYHDRDGRDYRT